MDNRKKDNMNEHVHVICKCRNCGQKLLECDYAEGDFTLEMKCTRCTRAIILKGYTFERLKAYAKHGQALKTI